MGLGIGISRSSYDRDIGRRATYDGYGYNAGYNALGWWNNLQNRGNPDPTYFKIKEFIQIGSYLAVKINYPNCNNYEGDKILVFDGVTFEELSKQKSIDPHFSINKKFKSPIARFEPTTEGWVNCLKFCSMLNSERIELEC